MPSSEWRQTWWLIKEKEGQKWKKRNEQDREGENTFTFPNTNESLHHTHDANSHSTRKPKQSSLLLWHFFSLRSILAALAQTGEISGHRWGRRAETSRPSHPIPPPQPGADTGSFLAGISFHEWEETNVFPLMTYFLSPPQRALQKAITNTNLQLLSFQMITPALHSILIMFN